MADEEEDDKEEGGEVFHFKTLVPRILKRRERDKKKGGSDDRLFARTPARKDGAPKVTEIPSARQAAERSVWGGKLRNEAIQSVRAAFKPVTELSVRSSLVRRLVLALPAWMTADRVTAFRTLLLMPIIAYVAYGRYDDATLLYAFAMFLDFLDGAIAKNRNQATVQGAMYDSTADKIVNCGLLMYLQYKQLLPDPVGMALVAITCAFATLNVMMRIAKLAMSGDRRPKIEAADAGKIKLVTETIAILLILQALASGFSQMMDFGLLTLTLASLFAAWSFREQCRFS